MITREEYLNALEIIDQYHRQLDSSTARRSLSWEDLQPGDKIIFEKVMSKFLTEGKEYTVTRVGEGWKSGDCFSNFEIIDDRGKQKGLPKHPKGYIVRMA